MRICMCASRHLSWACVCMHMDVCLCAHVCNEAGFHMNGCVLHVVGIKWMCRSLLQLCVHFAFSYLRARVLASVLGAVWIGIYSAILHPG